MLSVMSLPLMHAMIKSDQILMLRNLTYFMYFFEVWIHLNYFPVGFVQ